MTAAKTRIAAFDRATFELVHAEHGIEWRPHGFRGPIKYAVLVCARCDRSLVIVDDDKGADSMARKKTDAEQAHEAHNAQPPLIKMSREELEEAGQSLAGKISELEELDAAHKASREEQSPPDAGQGVIKFFCGGTPKSMKVGGVARFMKAGKMHFVPKRGNDEWATLVGRIGRDHAPERPLEGPLILVATFWMPRPGSLPKRTAHLAMPIKRPDVDNLFFKLTDSFNGVLWLDDSQIVDVVLRKRYPLDGRTGVEIVVAAVTNVQIQSEISQLLLDREVTA